MRIKPAPEPDASGKTKHPTRAERSNAKAAARIEARHVERDFFGQPVRPLASEEADAATPASIKRARRGAIRLDAWLVSNGAAPSRDKAKRLIDAGLVSVDGSASVKASTPVTDAMVVEVRAGEGSSDEADGADGTDA